MFLILLVCGARSQTVNVGASRVSQQQYIQQLDSWQNYLQREDNGEGLQRPPIPSEWVVQTATAEYHVPADFLFMASDAAGKKSVLQHLRELRAAASANREWSSMPSARVKAQKILSEREFRGVHAPGLRESMIDRLVNIATHLLEKAFGKAVENAALLRTMVTVATWVILLGATSILFFWFFRILRDFSNPEFALEGRPPEYVSSKPPETWLEEARNAADQGQYRLAICLAYWAGITGLERTGAWRPDRARTPREYLRKAGDASFLPVLRTLTREFERTWYAGEEATNADFEAYVTRVRELGWQ